MAEESSYTPKLYLRPVLNYFFLDLSGTISSEIVIHIGRLPQTSQDADHQQPIIVPRKDTVLDAYHCLKNGTLRFEELDKLDKDDKARPITMSFDGIPQCLDSTIELKPGGLGPGQINKHVYQDITYPIDLKSLQAFRSNTFYRLVYYLDGSDASTGLTWWRKPNSSEIPKTIPQARFVQGSIFKAREKVEIPPKFDFEISIQPQILSLSKPMPVTFTVKITLVEDELYTVENNHDTMENIFAENLVLFNLVVVNSTTNRVLSHARRSSALHPPKEKTGYQRSEFREFQPRQTVELRREIPAENVQRLFRDELYVESIDSLKGQAVDLRLRTSGLSQIPGIFGDNVSIWWMKKSVEELFDGRDVIYNVGDRVYMKKITLPSDLSAPFSVVD